MSGLTSQHSKSLCTKSHCSVQAIGKHETGYSYICTGQYALLRWETDHEIQTPELRNDAPSINTIAPVPIDK